MNDSVLIIGGLVLVANLLTCGFRSLGTMGVSKVDPPKSFSDYIRAGARGDNVCKSPRKVVIPGLILGGLLWILSAPQMFFNWLLSFSKKMKKHPKITFVLSIGMAIIFWMVIVTNILNSIPPLYQQLY